LYNLKLTDFQKQAGDWFLHSGIQEPSGGVARYYRAETCANLPVSNEITGYFASALIGLHLRTGCTEYLDAAVRASHFLVREAWDKQSSTFPFEPGSHLAYFFDIGIIVRGLLAVWRVTREEELFACAHAAALSLGFDFLGEGVFHPVISLPEKQPLPYERRWSGRPGCFQLKAALAWKEIGDPQAERMFGAMLEYALTDHHTFLEFENDRDKLMDWLHAECYFLEGLLFALGRDDVGQTNAASEALEEGMARTSELLQSISQRFERSDVYAQMLRIRLVAHYAGAVALDEDLAAEEAARLATFQEKRSSDPRLRGGFWFGLKNHAIMPFSNPVSTAFGMQSLALWNDHRAGRWDFDLSRLI
jgi:hypothetical protein